MFRRILLICMILMAAPSYVTADEPREFQSSIKKTALHRLGAETHPLVTIDEGSHHVRMVVFTTYGGYKTTDEKLGSTVWATVEPELKQRCTDYVKKQKVVSHEQLTLWIAELLGLPTKQAGERRFVVLDLPVIQAYYGLPAQNIGIFRPCTDPRIGPHADKSPICPAKMDPLDANISTDYKTWFINNSITSYTLNNDARAPWTEFGYTYNWNPEAESVDGVSEFVILKDSLTSVIPNPVDARTAYVSAEQYCGVN